MKVMDNVEVVTEKERYAKRGVHKGMQGVIWEDERIDGEWVVLFPRYGAKPDIADIRIKEEDLKVVRVMDARVNERIEAEFSRDEDA